jgi:hypothetical protein
MNKVHAFCFVLMMTTFSFAGCTSSNSESTENTEDFEIQSASYNHTLNGNEPLVFVTMHNRIDMNWESVVLQLSVNRENFTTCTTPVDESGSFCHATDDGDGNWTEGETITISEGFTNSCDGSHNCNVQIKIFVSHTNLSPIPDIAIESLNRSGIEENYTTSDGEIQLSEFRGDVIILNMMAHDCSNCGYVQAHLEERMDDWITTAEANGVGFHIFGYGAWYQESVEYLNASGGAYTVPMFPVGLGSDDAATLADGSHADPVSLFSYGSIPLVMIIDVEGYIVEKQSSATPVGGWGEFDSSLESALSGNVTTTISDRVAWENPTLTLLYESALLSLEV